MDAHLLQQNLNFNDQQDYDSEEDQQQVTKKKFLKRESRDHHLKKQKKNNQMIFVEENSQIQELSSNKKQSFTNNNKQFEQFQSTETFQAKIRDYQNSQSYSPETAKKSSISRKNQRQEDEKDRQFQQQSNIVSQQKNQQNKNESYQQRIELQLNQQSIIQNQDFDDNEMSQQSSNDNIHVYQKKELIMNKLDEMKKLMKSQIKLRKDLFQIKRANEKPQFMISQSRADINTFIFDTLERTDYNNIHTHLKKSKELQMKNVDVFKNLIHNVFDINQRANENNIKIYGSGFDIQKALNAMKHEDGRDPNPFYYQRQQFQDERSQIQRDEEEEHDQVEILTDFKKFNNNQFKQEISEKFDNLAYDQVSRTTSVNRNTNQKAFQEKQINNNEQQILNPFTNAEMKIKEKQIERLQSKIQQFKQLEKELKTTINLTNQKDNNLLTKIEESDCFGEVIIFTRFKSSSQQLVNQQFNFKSDGQQQLNDFFKLAIKDLFPNEQKDLENENQTFGQDGEENEKTSFVESLSSSKQEQVANKYMEISEKFRNFLRDEIKSIQNFVKQRQIAENEKQRAELKEQKAFMLLSTSADQKQKIDFFFDQYMTEPLNLQFQIEHVNFMDLDQTEIKIHGKNYKILKVVNQELKKQKRQLFLIGILSQYYNKWVKGLNLKLNQNEKISINHLLVLDKSLVDIKIQLCKQFKIEYFGESIYDDLSRESSSSESQKSKQRLNQYEFDGNSASFKDQRGKRVNSQYTDKKISNMSSKDYGSKRIQDDQIRKTQDQKSLFDQ